MVRVQTEFQRQRNSRNFDDSKSCRCCEERGTSVHVHLETLTGKPLDKFMMPVLCFNVISGRSHSGNCLTCPEFLFVPIGACSVAEDMITDTEVYHTLKLGHQEDVRRNAWLVTRQALLRVCSSTKRWTSSRILLSWIRVSCHVANEERVRIPRMFNPTLC